MSEPVKNNASSSEPKRSGFKRKYLRPGEAGSKYIVVRDQRNNNNNNQNPPPPPTLQNPVEVAAATGSESNDVAAVGQNFTGVIDGIFSGGYLISIKIENSNGPILKGLVYKSGSQVSGEINEEGFPKPLENKRKRVFEINLNDTVREEEGEQDQELEEVEKEESPSVEELSKALVLYTGDSTESPGNFVGRPLVESMVAEPLESSSSSSGVGAKLVPVVFKPATDLPYLRKGKSISGNYGTDRDPFLPVNWPSPAIGIPPPSPSLRNEGTSAGSIVTPSPLPYIGFGRQRERETPTAEREYEKF